MEKSENRKEYMDNFCDVLSKFTLTGKDFNDMLKELLELSLFKDYEKAIKPLNGSELAQKVFILTELTKDRYPCHRIIQLLEKHMQIEAAKLLNNYNTSKGMMKMTAQIEIPFNYGMHPIEYLSSTYSLVDNPRGICVIINNITNPRPSVYMNSNGKAVSQLGLEREAQRFQYVFEKLFFKVVRFNELSAEDMTNKLVELKNDQISTGDQAFILIVLSHGQDKSVFGYNNFTDQVKMKHLISIFTQNCPQLNGKPKLFFFICCREQSLNCSNGSNLNQRTGQQKSLIENGILEKSDIMDEPMDCQTSDSTTKKPKRDDPNEDTFVCYSCAKEYKTYFDNFYGMSYFGQALTHAIAQYACDVNLDGIMTNTCRFMDSMYKKSTVSSELLGTFAIQVSTFKMRKNVHFNPGY